jgi:hypothetical protein
MSRGLTEDQAKTAAKIREQMEKEGLSSPLMLPRTDLAEAHRQGYSQLEGADAKTVSAYVSSNLASPVFWAAMGFDCSDMKQFLGEEILRNLKGKNEVFPKDKDLYRDSLKIASGLAFESKSRVTIEGDYKHRSDAELEFFVRNGKWPEESPTINAE